MDYFTKREGGREREKEEGPHSIMASINDRATISVCMTQTDGFGVHRDCVCELVYSIQVQPPVPLKVYAQAFQIMDRIVDKQWVLDDWDPFEYPTALDLTLAGMAVLLPEAQKSKFMYAVHDIGHTYPVQAFRDFMSIQKSLLARVERIVDMHKEDLQDNILYYIDEYSKLVPECPPETDMAKYLALYFIAVGGRNVDMPHSLAAAACYALGRVSTWPNRDGLQWPGWTTGMEKATSFPRAYVAEKARDIMVTLTEAKTRVIDHLNAHFSKPPIRWKKFVESHKPKAVQEAIEAVTCPLGCTYLCVSRHME